MSRAIPPLISIIVAMTPDRVIGRDNALPWHLPADLKHFKAVTMGKPIIMGRRTWESLPGLLPGRRHILITRNTGYRAEGAEIAHSLEQAIELAGGVEEIMIVGGAALYAQALPLADRIYLTLVEADVQGDAHFPDYDESQWREIENEPHSADDRNPFAYSFRLLERAI